MDDYDSVRSLVRLIRRLKLINVSAEDKLVDANYWHIVIRVKGYETFLSQVGINK